MLPQSSLKPYSLTPSRSYVANSEGSHRPGAVTLLLQASEEDGGKSSGTKGGRGQGASDDEDPYMKYETKRMPFNKALVNLLPDEHFEWANSM